MLRVAAQLGLAVAVAFAYGLENPAFLRVFALAAAGFVVHAVLPLRFRLPWFVLLSLAGLVMVFRPADAAWLFGTGLVLVGLAQLPVGGMARVALLGGAGLVLAVARAGLIPVPWSPAVWPILGSMFMFRLVLYVMSLRTEARDARGWWALAYFFMLPNLVFPLFPVVDYQTFRRTYFDRNEREIYDVGLVWIVRGLCHLLLYRFVYHNVITDAESIVTLGDLVQFMLATFLLYLRVSGQFHLIVGLLHVFGFRLPETHKLYYLAHSFTELWRRINIYWTDFMMKTVFYPAYFKVKHLPPARALVLATSAVFVVTWLLHSYQWFWLRGGFPLTVQDTAFWAILGALVVVGGLRDLKAGRRPRSAPGTWNTARGIQAATTFGFFCVLWSLWSTESVTLWIWMLGAAGHVDLKGVVLLVGCLGLVFALGGWDWQGQLPSGSGWTRPLLGVPARVTATLVLLFALAQPAVQGMVHGRAADALQSLRASGLNARDLARQHRGYYEQLDVRAQLDAPVAAAGRLRDEQWQELSQLGVLRERSDLLVRDLRPSTSTTWNGNAFSTNEWGMRDRPYAKARPDRTLRIALLGPSHVMGNGVADGETFEALAETALNRMFAADGYLVEVLNFGVDGYSLPQQVALLQDRVFAFSPDVVVATHYVDNRELTTGFLLKVLDRRMEVPPGELRDLIDGAGLLGHSVGIPVPSAWARALAGLVGVDTRIPYGEAQARAHQVSNAVLAASFRQFASVTRAHGAVPAVLALNVVIDDPPAEMPMGAEIRAAGLPLIDLFDVYPAGRRDQLRVAPWDDHPNAEAHRLVAARLAPALAALVRSDVLGRPRPDSTGTVSPGDLR